MRRIATAKIPKKEVACDDQQDEIKREREREISPHPAHTATYNRLKACTVLVKQSKGIEAHATLLLASSSGNSVPEPTKSSVSYFVEPPITHDQQTSQATPKHQQPSSRPRINMLANRSNGKIECHPTHIQFNTRPCLCQSFR